MTYNTMSHITHPHWAAEIIDARTGGFRPRLAMVLGSGLGKVAEQIEDRVTIPYAELPHFAVSKVAGHNAKLHLGILKGVPVVCMEGRTHTYEGDNALEVIRTIFRTLKLIGCETVLTTCAVGSLNIDTGPGDLVLINDHINFMFSNPLIGPNDESFGERFVSMDNVYDAVLGEKIAAVAQKQGIKLREGVYLATSGPTFETHAEIRMYKMLGADVVGMSNVPEVIVSRHAGMKVASICAVTNYAAGLSNEVLSHEGTLKGAALAVEKLATLILEAVTELGK